MPVETGTVIAAKSLELALKGMYNAGKEKLSNAITKIQNTNNIKKLAKNIKRFGKVKTLWQIDKEVGINEFYYPSKVIFPDHNMETQRANSLRDIPTGNNYVITGTVGQGKSIFLRHLCIQELSNDSSGRIPVFVELRKVDKDKPLEQLITLELEKLGFETTDDLVGLYASTGKIVLLLDAFDELDSDCIKTTMRFIEDWAESYPSAQIIATSRPDNDLIKSPHFHKLTLAPISSSDHKPFLQKIGVKGASLAEMLDAIKQSPHQVSELLSTPLLLTLLVMVYKSEKQIPSNLPDFFAALFSTVFMKHDKNKPYFTRKSKTGLTERELEKIFSAFCFYTTSYQHGVSLNLNQFSKSFAKAIQFTNSDCTEESFKSDIVKIACLMQTEGDLTSFIHKSLLEYYTASFVANLNEDQAIKFYNTLLERPRSAFFWKPALSFLKQIDKFRHTKYHAIPAIKSCLATFGISDLSQWDGRFEDITNNILAKCICVYHVGNDNTFRKSYTTFEEGVGYGYFNDRILDTYLREVARSTSGADSLSTFLRLYPAHETTADNGYKIKGNCIVDDAQRDKLSRTLKTDIEHYHDLLEELTQYIKSEHEKTSLLFDPLE